MEENFRLEEIRRAEEQRKQDEARLRAVQEEAQKKLELAQQLKVETIFLLH